MSLKSAHICFLARPIYDKVSTRVYNCLKESFDANIQGCFVTTNKIETAYVQSQVENAHIAETFSYIKSHWNEYNIADLVKIEEQLYDCKPIWSFIYTDRFLIHREYEYAVKMTIGLFYFFEELYSKGDFDYYYSEPIATLLCYVSYIVGKKYGVKYVAQMGARGLDSTHHYILNDPYQSNVRMEREYLKLSYSDEEKKAADDFLKQFEDNDIKPTYMIKNGAIPRIKIRYALLPIKRFVKGFSDEFNDPYSYIHYWTVKSLGKK